MKPWQFAVVSLALVATTGCRSDPAVPLLERELRRKEDEIYRLRAQLEEFQDCGSCQVVTGGPKATPAEATGSPRGHAAVPNGIAPPSIELPGQPSSSVPDALKKPTPSGSLPAGVPDVPESLRGPSKPLSPKDLEPSTKPTSRSRSPAPLDSDGPMLEKGPGGVSSRSGRINLASLSAAPLTPAGDSRHVAGITLNRTLTGSILGEDRSGDQGLLVVVEPRDSDGRSVDAPAEISVVVLDPALKGDACRVARWDFTAAETAGMFRRSGSGQAIHLAAAWPADPPAHRKLHLFVRYVTADGRRLEANQPIEVVLPGDQENRGTTADAAPASPHTAARSDESQSQRPVWSPDRR
jgi:hypothetical protein